MMMMMTGTLQKLEDLELEEAKQEPNARVFRTKMLALHVKGRKETETTRANAKTKIEETCQSL